jgi:hypothetical protein
MTLSHFRFVPSQVRNAQRAGAAAVIIADTTCLCYDDQCMKASGLSTCETAEPIMADDGSGGDISIPSFLMFKRDADSVKDELKLDHPVQMEMTWSLPNPDDRVEYDLWSVPSDPVSVDFLKNFKTSAVALGSHAYFTPHLYVYDGVRSHCLGNDGHNMCYNLCTNNGRYCATDPDNDLEKGISGADVVKESLRRICIWKHYGEKDGIGEKWWDYVSKFVELCNTADYFMNEDCVKDAYRKVGIDGDVVTHCMNDSGGLTADKVNNLLDAEIRAQNERGVVVLPTVFVNSAALRGALSVNNVFSAICSGFAVGTTPKICQQCATCSNQQKCVEADGVCLNPGQKADGGSVSTHTFLFSLLLVTGLFAGVGAWHYKKTREDMREQVRGILAEYMPLEDQEDGASPMDFARRGAATSLMS